MKGYRIAVIREYVVLADSEREAIAQAKALNKLNETTGLVYSGHESHETMTAQEAEDILRPEPDAVFLRDGDGTTYSTTI